MTWGVAIAIIIAITLIDRAAASSRAKRAAIADQAYEDGYASALPAGNCAEDGHAWTFDGGPQGEFCRICYLPRSEADE